MHLNHLAVCCPKCREWMALSEFSVGINLPERTLSVDGEIECPNPECELVFSIEGGEAIYQRSSGE